MVQTTKRTRNLTVVIGGREHDPWTREPCSSCGRLCSWPRGILEAMNPDSPMLELGPLCDACDGEGASNQASGEHVQGVLEMAM